MQTPTKNSNQLPKGGNRFTQWLGACLLKLTGWKIKGELPNAAKMVVSVAPHTSNWDFFLGVAVLFKLGIKVRFLGKHTIFKPGLKQLLNLIGGMPVDRRHAQGIVGQIVKEFERQQQLILAIAPEGTRSPIYPWKTGFVTIAHRAGVPIVLIAFDFKLRRVIIGPTWKPTGDVQIDMRNVYAFYKAIHAKHPENVMFGSNN